MAPKDKQQRETTAHAYCSSWNVEETTPANEILVAHGGSVCEQALTCIVRDPTVVVGTWKRPHQQTKYSSHTGGVYANKRLLA